MIDLCRVRVAKLRTSLFNPVCWPALRLGVAPSIEHRAVLESLKTDGIIDVGANRGQFTLMCQLVHPGVPVVSFEPIPHEAAIFRKVHGARPNVELIDVALGSHAGNATMHLSRSADSSSLLPIGKSQAKLFKGTDEVGTITVAVQRLDDFSQRWSARTRQLLKLDVQGFELEVLRGAVETLKSCAYVYAECSDVALYERQALRADVESFLEGQGFQLQSRCNEHSHNGALIQADYLFTRHA